MNVLDFPEKFRLTGEALARAQNDVLRAEKKAKRIYSAIIMASEGSIAQREHAARIDPSYTAAEDVWLDSDLLANSLRAELDAMKIAFEIWRSRNANKRAEMNL